MFRGHSLDHRPKKILKLYMAILGGMFIGNIFGTWCMPYNPPNVSC